MLNTTRVTARRAFITTELVIGIVLLGLIATLAHKSMLDYARTTNTYSTRQAAIWAAAAQLQRYQAGAAIDSQPPPGLIAGNITLNTHLEPGKDQWQGFSRVTVTASATVRDKVIHEQMSAYLPPEVSP